MKPGATKRTKTGRVLYKVRLVFETVILADPVDSPKEVEDIMRPIFEGELEQGAEGPLLTELDNFRVESFQAIERVEDLPNGWNMECIPWNTEHGWPDIALVLKELPK